MANAEYRAKLKNKIPLKKMQKEYQATRAGTY